MASTPGFNKKIPYSISWSWSEVCYTYTFSFDFVENCPLFLIKIKGYVDKRLSIKLGWILMSLLATV